jgi:hypothetical protein
LHFPEQHSPFLMHNAPAGMHAHATSALQSPSLQSTVPSQSLSEPSLQVELGSSFAGGEPQSATHVHESSPTSQVPSPQNGGGPQSTSQL